jgi:excisionase family DNA binding protein
MIKMSTNMTKSNLESLQTNIKQLIENQREKPFTFREACKYLDLSPSFLYKLTSSGKIAFSKPGGKKLYFTKANLDEYLLGNPIHKQIPQAAIDNKTK